MFRYLSALALVCVVAACASCAPSPDAGRARAVATQLPACATEDSDNCYWDAARGNGEGRSFVVRDGVVTYLP